MKIISQWMNTFNVIGSKGLMLKKENHTSSFQKKLAIVELYLSNDLSYQDIALKKGISNPSMICVWVNRFRTNGPKGLRAHKKGRKSTLSKVIKDTSTSSNKNHTIDTSVEHVRELEEELLKLRTENAFFKS